MPRKLQKKTKPNRVRKARRKAEKTDVAEREEGKVRARLIQLYGEQVSGKSWFALPDGLLGLFGKMIASDEITPQEAYALIMLLRLEYNSKGEIWIGYERISQYLGVRERRARDIINALEQKGLVDRKYSRLGLKNRANKYDLSGLHSRLSAIFPQWRKNEEKRRSRYSSRTDDC